MAFQYMLMAAQAAGFVTDLWATRKQEKFARMGADIERRELDLQMQQETLASTEQAVQNTDRLRETLAYQRAVYASRGQAGGQGVARSVANAEVGAYNADERARQLSLSFRKHQLESSKRLINIGLYGQQSKNRNDSLVKGINLLNINELFGGQAKINKRSTKLNAPRNEALNGLRNAGAQYRG